MLEELIVIYPHGFQFITCFKRLEIGMWSEFLHLFWDNFLHSCLVHPYIDLDKLFSRNKFLSVISTLCQLVYPYRTSIRFAPDKFYFTTSSHFIFIFFQFISLPRFIIFLLFPLFCACQRIFKLFIFEWLFFFFYA